MKKEYYIVALNNNPSRNPLKIDNIIYRGKLIDMPKEIVSLYDEYEGIEVLAVKTSCGFKEVISGEMIEFSENGLSNGLSYSRIIKANNNDIVRIIERYKNMSLDDINRYKKNIYEIKNKSIKLYNEDVLKKINEIEKEKNAFDFLNYMEEYGV